MPRKHHTGLSRLGPYAAERQGSRAVDRRCSPPLSAGAHRSPAGTSSEHAIDNGIRAGRRARACCSPWSRYVAVNAAAWVLGTLTWLGARERGPADRCSSSAATSSSTSRRSRSATSRSRRPGWIIARLTSDVDALSDVLNQGLTTLVVNSLDARRRGRRPLPARLAARPRRAAACSRPASWSRAGSSASRTSRGADVRTRIAIVTAQLGRVGRGHGGRAGVQPRARVPGRVRRAERARTASRTSTSQKIYSVFFPRSSCSGSIATAVGALRRRAAHRLAARCRSAR